MQFIDLKKQYNKLKSEINTSIQHVLDSSSYIMGREVEDLENQLAEYVEVEACLTCGNGTDALILSLKTFDIKYGDAVFVPTFTFFATAEAVSACGATPIFVDIDENTFNISPEDLDKAINQTIKQSDLIPRAIIAVDLFGLPFDYIKIGEIAKKYNLLVIEDGAQGFGGSVENKKACSFGDLSTTSFFPSKPLGCYGDGGAIFIKDRSVKEYIESLRNHGKGKDKYDNIRIGMNSRLDTIQAAVLLVKLKAFREYELCLRNNVAALYNERLKDLVKIPYVPPGYVSSYAQYSILLESEEQRDNIKSALSIQDIPGMIYYKKSMHQQTVYRNNLSTERKFDTAEKVSKTILSLPIDPYLEEDQISLISTTIQGALLR